MVLWLHKPHPAGYFHLSEPGWTAFIAAPSARVSTAGGAPAREPCQLAICRDGPLLQPRSGRIRVRSGWRAGSSAALRRSGVVVRRMALDAGAGGVGRIRPAAVP